MQGPKTTVMQVSRKQFLTEQRKYKKLVWIKMDEWIATHWPFKAEI